MWVETTKNGKYKFCERYTDYLTGKIKKVSVTIDRNTPQSRKLARQTLQDKINQALVSDPDHPVTLRFLIDHYREYQKKTVKASTYSRNYWQCETFLKLFGESTLVERINARLVIGTFLQTGKDAGTLNEHLARFKALMRWGFRNDFVKDIDFLSKIEPFKDIPHRQKISDKYLEGHELKLLLNSMAVNEWNLLTKFMVLSGLRTGEALALNKSDVSLKHRIIHINKNYDSINKVFTTPKTECSIRDIHMQKELYECCREINSFYLHKKLSFGSQTTLFMFDADGGPLHYYAFNKYLKSVSSECIGRPITPHALRHTHASLLLAQGVPIDTISRRLGHENSKITKEIYLHITQELQAKDNERLSQVKLL